MKSACLILACVLGQANAGFDILAALHGGAGHKKGHHSKKKMAKDDPTGILGQIMAATSQGLATAEKQHDVAVKAARDEMQSLLQKQVTTLSESVKLLGADLSASTVAVEEAKEAAQKSLKASESKPKPAGLNSWDLGPDAEIQARLSTKINSADRWLEKADRKRQRSIDEAVSKIDSLLEEDDSVRHFTRKVGDMTQVIKDAVAPLDEVGKSVAAEKPANKTSLLQQKEQAMDMDKAQANLLAAQKGLEKSADAAHKAFDVAYDKAAKNYATALKSLSDGLDGEQKKELDIVHGAAQSVSLPKVSTKKKVDTTKKVDTPKDQLRGKKHA